MLKNFFFNNNYHEKPLTTARFSSPLNCYTWLCVWYTDWNAKDDLLMPCCKALMRCLGDAISRYGFLTSKSGVHSDNVGVLGEAGNRAFKS